MTIYRHAQHRKKRLSKVWRRPKGLHNKMRLQKKGHRGPLKEGFMTQASTRGMRKGLAMKTVYNEADILSEDSTKTGLIIGNVGQKKKIVLLELINKEGFTLFTGKPVEELKALKESFAARKKETKEKAAEKEKKQQELEKEAAKKEAAEKKEAEKENLEEKVEEEKKAEEKQKEKVLTKAR